MSTTWSGVSSYWQDANGGIHHLAHRTSAVDTSHAPLQRDREVGHCAQGDHRCRPSLKAALVASFVPTRDEPTLNLPLAIPNERGQPPVVLEPHKGTKHSDRREAADAESLMIYIKVHFCVSASSPLLTNPHRR